jgi:hypothetical protein
LFPAEDTLPVEVGLPVTPVATTDPVSVSVAVAEALTTLAEPSADDTLADEVSADEAIDDNDDGVADDVVELPVKLLVNVSNGVKL